MAKPIPIDGSDDFAKLLKALADDIRLSHDCYHLYRKLERALKEYETEFAQSPAF